MKRLLVAMLLLYPLSALAQTYQWTDDRGTVNFTEDLGKVPKKYRKKLKMLEGADTSPQSTAIPEQEKAKPKGEEGSKAISRGEEAPKAKRLFGGKDENTWRREFAVANGELQQTESELAELRRQLNDTSKMSRSEYLTIQNTVRSYESRLPQQKKKLELLRESADRLGVPKQYRQ